MPAVRNFALYAALSVFVNAALQVTVFVGFMALDLARVEASTCTGSCLVVRPSTPPTDITYLRRVIVWIASHSLKFFLALLFRINLLLPEVH
jgi:hypothetical protein